MSPNKEVDFEKRREQQKMLSVLFKKIERKRKIKKIFNVNKHSR